MEAVKTHTSKSTIILELIPLEGTDELHVSHTQLRNALPTTYRQSKMGGEIQVSFAPMCLNWLQMDIWIELD